MALDVEFGLGARIARAGGVVPLGELMQPVVLVESFSRHARRGCHCKHTATGQGTVERRMGMRTSISR